MENMLKALEELRRDSELVPGVIVALSNGTEIIGFCEDDNEIADYLDKGYWRVNCFKNGISLGIGI